jgi:hypothetical protein
VCVCEGERSSSVLTPLSFFEECMGIEKSVTHCVCVCVCVSRKREKKRKREGERFFSFLSVLFLSPLFF